MKYNAGASYLKKDEWVSISAYLEPFVSELIKVSQEFSLNFERSPRWPALEMSRKKDGKWDSFKFLLNSNYLEDNRIFFEFIFNQFSKKIFGRNSVETTEVLGEFSLQDMQNIEFVLEDIKNNLVNKI